MKKILLLLFLLFSGNCYSKISVKNHSSFQFDKYKNDTNAILKLDTAIRHYLNEGKSQEVYQLIQQTNSLSSKLNYSKGHFLYFLQMAKLNRITKNFDTSFYYYNKAFSQGEQLFLYPEYIEAKHQMAVICRNQGKYVESLRYNYECYETALLNNDTLRIGRYLISIGNIYILSTLYDQSLDAYLNALDYLKKVNYKRGIGVCYMNIGNVFLDQKDYQKALNYYNKGLKIHEKIGRFNSQAGCLANVAETYFKQGKIDSAKIFYTEAKSRFLIHDKNTPPPRANIGLGDVYLYYNNYDSAINYYQSALDIWSSRKEKENILKAYNKLGDAYSQKGNNKKASDYLDSALTIALNIKSHIRIKEVYFSFYLSNKKSNDLKSAISNYENYVVYKDSIFNDKNRQNFIYTEICNEFEHKLEIWELDKNKREQIYILEKDKNKKIKTSLFVIILLLAIISIILFAFWIFNKVKNKLILQKNEKITEINKELQMQNEEIHNQKENQRELFENKIEAEQRELSSKLLQLSLKNKTNEQISDLLKSIQANAKLTTTLKIELNQTLNKLTINENKSFWKEFEARFTQINNGFLSRLDTGYPNLSSTERQICIFLKMDLNTKEIGLITNKTIRSIEIARTRLREKLNLKGTKTDLPTFIQNL